MLSLCSCRSEFLTDVTFLLWTYFNIAGKVGLLATNSLNFWLSKCLFLFQIWKEISQDIEFSVVGFFSFNPLNISSYSVFACGGFWREGTCNSYLGFSISKVYFFLYCWFSEVWIWYPWICGFVCDTKKGNLCYYGSNISSIPLSLHSFWYSYHTYIIRFVAVLIS